MGQYKEWFDTLPNFHGSDRVEFKGFSQKTPCLSIIPWDNYVCFAMWLQKIARYQHVRLTVKHPESAADYIHDLSEGFSVIPGAPEFQFVPAETDKYTAHALGSIDTTKISGSQLLGMLNFYRCISEAPNIPIVYGMLKEEVPELNFYQRLVASLCIVGTGKNPHQGHSPIHRRYVHNIKDLSLEALMVVWQQTYAFQPFSESHSYQTNGVMSTAVWLPPPWGMGNGMYGLHGPGLSNMHGFPMGPVTIKYLLDTKPDKKWVTYGS